MQPERPSHAEMIVFVRTHARGLGYAAGAARADGVKTIAVTP
jgi:hypothetical protein